MEPTLAVGSGSDGHARAASVVTPPPPYPGLPGTGGALAATENVAVRVSPTSRAVKAPYDGDSGSEDGSGAGAGGGEHVEVPATVMGEVKQQLWLAWPVIIAYLLQMSMGVVNLMMVGHVADHNKTFAAATLATMFANVTGFSIGIGLATALDTLCSQAYGAGNNKRLGLELQRGVVILGLVCVPIFVLWLNAEALLLAAQQAPDTASLSAAYVLRFIPGLWPAFIFECQKKFLQAQGRTMPSMAVTGVAAALNPVFAYVFVFTLDFGYLGAPMAISCSNVVLAVGGAYACWRYRGVDQEVPFWGGWSRECLNVRTWGPFLKLAGPGVVMLCAEWWSFEVVALGAGWLGTEELEVQGILMNTIALLFMLPLGVGVAVSVRVGNLIGAGNAAAAKRATGVAVGLAICMELLENVLLAWQRVHWGQLWTPEVAVVNLASNVILVAVCFDVLDGMQAVLSGILRGVGKQNIGAISNIASYSCIGIPSAFALAFPAKLGIYGLWMGLAIALVFQATIIGTVVCRINWPKQVELARLRVGADAAPAGDKRGHPVRKDGYATVEMAVAGQVGSDDDDVLAVDDDQSTVARGSSRNGVAVDAAARSTNGRRKRGRKSRGGGGGGGAGADADAAPLLHALAERSAAHIRATGTGLQDGTEVGDMPSHMGVPDDGDDDEFGAYLAHTRSASASLGRLGAPAPTAPPPRPSAPRALEARVTGPGSEYR